MPQQEAHFTNLSGQRKHRSVSTVAARSVLVLALLGLLSVNCLVVQSMVVTNAPKSKTTNNIGVFSKKETSDDALLRMLLKGQGGNRNINARDGISSSYSFDANDKQKSPAINGGASTTTEMPRTSPLLDEWRAYEKLRPTTLEDEALRPFFLESGWERQQVIVNRFYQVVTTLYKAREDWNTAQEAKAASETTTNEQNEEEDVDDVDDEEVFLNAPTTDDPAALRLCEAVASLGPLAVKLGQTLSQRPDIVGKDACNALKRLQTQNTPFPDALAYAVIRESLDYWDGPLAENIDETPDATTMDSDKKPLFQSISKEPIASASLGQVYKATTWEGVDIALKIQRPDALSIIAIDTQCFRIAGNFRNNLIDLGEQWNAFVSGGEGLDETKHTPETGMTEDEVRAKGDEGTVASVIDRVARDIMREMDYRVEAANSYKFRDSLAFLGFVDTPDVLLATDKVLATRFVNGHHLASLKNPREELALARMAVEACTASMVLTGFVHADPHEGNLMLREDDGRIVFLDFGLMSDVDQDIMEAFARGIQALLSEDFVSMTEAFSDTSFVTTPIMHRHSTEDLWRVDPDYGLQELADQMEYHMKTTEGGLSRFGALATVLNKKISPNWLVFTPPYVLLLIRTFLTLEGIAAQVDPDFNIYEMSLPWVVRRSLSPSTEKGRKVLRNTILKADNKIQWGRIMELMEMQKAAATADATTSEESSFETAATPVDSSALTTTQEEKKGPTVPAATTREEKARKKEEFAAAQQGAMKDAIGTLLGSTNGRALRGVLKDLDTPDLIWKLGSKEGRPILKMATEKMLNSLFGRSKPSKSKEEVAKAATTEITSESNSSSLHGENENYRPISDACLELKEKQIKRSKQVTSFLIKRHLRKCLLGYKGIVGMARLMISTLQLSAILVLRNTMRRLKATIRPQTFEAK